MKLKWEKYQLIKTGLNLWMITLERNIYKYINLNIKLKLIFRSDLTFLSIYFKMVCRYLLLHQSSEAWSPFYISVCWSKILSSFSANICRYCDVHTSTESKEICKVCDVYFYVHSETCMIMIMVELLRHRSCDQKVPSTIPRSGTSVEVTSQC